jgi:hypothetical protein
VEVIGETVVWEGIIKTSITMGEIMFKPQKINLSSIFTDAIATGWYRSIGTSRKPRLACGSPLLT